MRANGPTRPIKNVRPVRDIEDDLPEKQEQPMSRRVFKVVEPMGEGVDRSALAGCLRAGAEVEYRLNVATQPRVPGSGLIAFESIEAAKVFAYSHPVWRRRERLQVWQADASYLLVMPPGLPRDAMGGE